MSSFIISKQEYVKCAAAIAAITDLCNKEEIMDVLIPAYVSNVASVNGQYGENTPMDDNEYNALFEDTYKFVKARNDSQEVIKYVLSFMASVLYQIEDNLRCAIIASDFIRLLRDITTPDSKCWGRFSYKDDVLRNAFKE